MRKQREGGHWACQTRELCRLAKKLQMAAQLEAAAESREAKVMRRLASALDDYGLSTIGKSVAMAYLRKLPRATWPASAREWLRKLNGSDLVPPSKTPARQRGCPELFEGLRAQPVWWRGCEETRSEFPPELAWVADVERNAPAMREELLKLEMMARSTSSRTARRRASRRAVGARPIGGIGMSFLSRAAQHGLRGA